MRIPENSKKDKIKRFFYHEGVTFKKSKTQPIIYVYYQNKLITSISSKALTELYNMYNKTFNRGELK